MNQPWGKAWFRTERRPELAHLIPRLRTSAKLRIDRAVRYLLEIQEVPAVTEWSRGANCLSGELRFPVRHLGFFRGLLQARLSHFGRSPSIEHKAKLQ